MQTACIQKPLKPTDPTAVLNALPTRQPDEVPSPEAERVRRNKGIILGSAVLFGGKGAVRQAKPRKAKEE